MSRNILFSILFIVVFTIFINYLLGSFWGEYTFHFSENSFSLSNAITVASIFLLLFIGEKITGFINKNVDEFLTNDPFKKRKNFVNRLHDYQYNYSFKLKL